MNDAVNPMALPIGAPEILLILLVLVLLFGAKKLPELARGSGRALRIFKSETKGLLDEDEQADADAAQRRDAAAEPPRQVESRRVEAQPGDDSAPAPEPAPREDQAGARPHDTDR
jgi:sec-independent protein translocase protein TatA